MFTLSETDKDRIANGIEGRIEADARLGTDLVRKIVLESGSIVAVVSFRPDITALQVTEFARGIATNPISISGLSIFSSQAERLVSTRPSLEDLNLDGSGSGNPTTSTSGDGDDDNTTLVIVVILIVVAVLAIVAVVVLQQRQNAEIERKAVPLAVSRGLRPALNVNSDIELTVVRGKSSQYSQATGYEHGLSLRPNRVAYAGASSDTDGAERVIESRLDGFYQRATKAEPIADFLDSEEYKNDPGLQEYIPSAGLLDEFETNVVEGSILTPEYLASGGAAPKRHDSTHSDSTLQTAMVVENKPTW